MDGHIITVHAEKKLGKKADNKADYDGTENSWLEIPALRQMPFNN